MQGSLWKTVAVVGVIGIGGLAILEVQKRLESQNVQMEPGDAEALAEQILAGGEENVTAELTGSEFDQMMADVNPAADQLQADQLQAGQFAGADLNQAPASQEVANSQPQASAFMENFGDSVPVDPQLAANAAVDTNVRAEGISQGNPFDETATTVTANLKAVPEDTSVQPTSFEDSPAFAEDSGAAAAATVESPGAAETEATGRAMLFAANPQETPAQPPAELKSVPEDTATLFFTADNSATSPSEPVSAEPANPQTAQFYGEGNPPADNNDLTPFRNETNPSAPPSNELVPFRDEAESQPAESAEPGFSAEPFTPEPFTPQPTPEPQPRPQPTPEPSFEPFPVDDSPAVGGNNQPQPTQPQRSQEIPFVEDLPNEVPTLDDPRGLTVPVPSAQPDRSFDQPDRSFEIPMDAPDRQPSTPDLQPFPTLPDAEPQFNRNTNSGRSDVTPADSSQPFEEDIEGPDLSAPRDFGGGMNNSTSPRSRDFGADPVPFPDNTLPEIRPSGDSSTPRNFGPDPRDFSDTPRIEPGRQNGFDTETERPSRVYRDPAVRQVASVMRPNVVLSKEAPDNATVGTPLKYRILVRNEGDATAYEVVVEDEVTSAAVVNAASPAATRDRSTNRLIWTFEEIAPGETKEIVVKVTPTGEGVLDGVATVKFKSRVKATTVITAPKLQLQMVGPDEVRLGEEVTYRYVITNKGSGEARSVFVRTVLPANGGLKHPAGNDLEYEITALKPDEQREIVLAVVAAEPGEFRAQAEVSAAGGAKDQASWRTNVVGAQLKIDRRGPKRRFVGRSAIYENIISNDTNFDALDARVTETVPQGMRFISASEGGRYDESARTVTWHLNRIGPGKMATLQVELMPTQAGPLESVVTIFENAGIQSDDYVSTTQVEDLHNVSADISQLDGPVAVGETFGFTISIDNRGTAAATDVELVVDVPEAIQVVGAGSREIPAKLLPGNEVEYRIIVRIAPNEQKDFELKLRGTQALRNGVVKASVHYKEMSEPLVVSESVTVYRDDL